MSAFERAHPLLACIFYLVAWCTVSGIVLWPFSPTKMIDRLPFVLCIGTIFLSAAIDNLPEAFPRSFEVIIGHSIHSMETTTQSTGTLFTEPWLERWQDRADTVFVWVTIAGSLGGLVNLVRRRAWITNTLAVGYTAWAFVWALLHASPL